MIGGTWKSSGIMTNWDSLVYSKLQWTVVTNLVHYKVRWNYDKLRQLSQFITKCNEQLLKILTDLLQSATRFITNCDRYYKVR